MLNHSNGGPDLKEKCLLAATALLSQYRRQTGPREEWQTFIKYNAKLRLYNAVMTKTKICVNNSQVTFRIHFAGNLCLIIRKIFLTSSIFCSNKLCYFFHRIFKKSRITCYLYVF